MSKYPECAREALIVDRFHSSCGACGKGADPAQKTHRDVVTYMVGVTKDAGCGVRWTQIASMYVGPGARKAAEELRPDLEWVDLYPGTEAA